MRAVASRGWLPRAVAAFAIVAASLFWPALASAQKSVPDGLRRGISWDLEAEVGFTALGIETLSSRFFVRAKAGVLLVSEPLFLSIDGVFEGSGMSDLAGGLQVSLLQLWWGIWGQAGLTVNGSPDLFFHVAAGYSIVGVEYQRQLTGDPRVGDDANALIVKLRIPVGIYFFGIQ